MRGRTGALKSRALTGSGASAIFGSGAGSGARCGAAAGADDPKTTAGAVATEVTDSVESSGFDRFLRAASAAKGETALGLEASGRLISATGPGFDVALGAPET